MGFALHIKDTIWVFRTNKTNSYIESLCKDFAAGEKSILIQKYLSSQKTARIHCTYEAYHAIYPNIIKFPFHLRWHNQVVKLVDVQRPIQLNVPFILKNISKHSNNVNGR